jgi:hypothetical protein
MKKLYDKARTAILTVVFIIWIIILFTRAFEMEVYITSVVLICMALFISPLIEYIIGRSEGNLSSFKVAFIVLGAFLSITLSIVLYSVMFSYNIKTSKNYESYNQIILIAVFYFLVMNVYRMVKEFRGQPDEDRSFILNAGIVLKYAIAFTLAFMLPLYQYSGRIYEVSPGNIKIPSRLEATVIIKPKMTVSTPFHSRPYKITEDKELIEGLISEIRTVKLDNIIGLDKIYYIIMKEKSYPFLEVYIDYNPGDPGMLRGIENGYFDSIEIYNNGQVILRSFSRENNILKNDSFRYFRVPLSESTLNKLRETFKDLNT